MMERFLERISLSEYRDKFILKGGMLVAAMVGLDARSTMDLDATLKGGKTLDKTVLHDALIATTRKRGTERHLAEAGEVMDEVENNPVLQKLWTAYQKKFSYAAELDWSNVIMSVRELCAEY
ncbi:hypothetical protein HMPREF9473_01410 [ [Hungatella hathewayi WAL-18680]|uniref:Nucleotidyl transferase AbiEii/AbiGii toxin family protein n=1 Tax=Hungatella hathewayi WAL-18680 TaxID=742737 RepID=G5ID36_9FIRM|nr:hypothetical protein HMPREF9473_01410 [ [Hungatella hathewayi WAL-18680]